MTDTAAASPPHLTKSDKQNRWIRRLGIAAAILFLLGAAFFFLVTTLAPRYLGDELQKQVQGHPTLRNEVGTVQSCIMNLSATIEYARPEKLIFDIKGDKGAAQLIVPQPSNYSTNYDLSKIVLRKFDGSEIPFEERVLE